MDFSPYIKGINATGFPFEHHTAELLRKHGWSVISNRYYIDDDEERPREIDLLAYKSSSFKHFDLRTTIIISCKKSESYHWAFLSRNVDLTDPNSNWKPVHFWCDDKPLSYILGQADWAADYHQLALAQGVKQILDPPSYEVFAFQELYCGPPKGEKKVGGSKGDSAIYASIFSAIKAQLYEMSIRSSRQRSKPIVYQFNILSLADAKFLRLHFEGGEIKPSEIGSALHIARYIVNRDQIFARVLFSTKDHFVSLLGDFDRLHEANGIILGEKRLDFYSGIERDGKRLKVLIPEFRDSLYRSILLSDFSPPFEIIKSLKEANLEWDKRNERLNILVTGGIDFDVGILNRLELRPIVAEALKKTYQYEGAFAFEEDIPF
ncbi:hypothetical protein [Alcaligenes faecalis]|uniref:hypothetical protein n=1 Tax=Alcaligenes faecalis TaxID=511 RepID=UPI00208E33C2|nr:hypothetical protein [Alcaligenes faecalis]USP49138.1 hypothetical protein J5J84_06470 [Alcaligenes faecalis]